MEERLQKILSAAGVCSRRKAEAYLRAGRVKVNGLAAGIGDKADPNGIGLRWWERAVHPFRPYISHAS